MLSLVNKNILLGVTGSIAAYKAAELARLLRRHGAEVRVVLSAGGAAFVTPLTFQALSGHPVHSDLLDTAAEAAMSHIQLARWADAVVIAPASANCIARLAQGRAEDLLAAVCLATEAPVAVAPAMNQQMWAKSATQENLQQLARRGVRQFGPASGDQACGETGPGRMLEAEELLAAIAGLFVTGALAGRTVLVTAGPTREALDPVRYLTNRSSGKMGFAVAQAVIEAGARCILVSGPVSLATPEHAERIDVESAMEMHAAVLARAGEADVFIGVAAVADYRPATAAAQKIKKDEDTLNLALVRNPDVLAAVAALPNAPLCVGFAAETEQLAQHAMRKLEQKRVAMIAANRVDAAGAGFDSDDNALTVFTRDGVIELPRERKSVLARRLVALIAERLARRG